MAKEVAFSEGTIVEDEFLNHLQEGVTGLVTGLRLADGSGNPAQVRLLPTVQTDTGGSLRGNLVAIDGDNFRIAWMGTSTPSGATLTATQTAGAGTFGIYAQTSDAIQSGNEGKMNLVLSATHPSDFVRKLGEVTSSAGNVLSNYRLTNGVQIDADQYNNLTLRTILNGPGEIPLTLRGGTSQNTSSSKLLSVGYDTAGPTYNEKWYLSALGRIVTTQPLAADEHYRAFVGSDTQPSLVLAGRSILLGPGGSTAPNVTIEHTGTGVVKVTDTIDVVAIRNTGSGTGGVAGGQAGMVNVNDDLNLATGATYRIAGTALASTNLSDTANLAYLGSANAFTGANTMTNPLTGTGANGYFVRNSAASGDVAIRTKISTDTEYRLIVDAAGKHLWGLGSATVGDVSLERTAVGILKVTKAGAAARAAVQVSDAPSAGDDLTNKTYVDGKVAVSVTTTVTITAASYTILTTDDTVFVNRAGVVTLTLPTADGVAGKRYVIKDISGAAGTNNVTINRAGADTIDGATSYLLDTNYEWVTIVSDGSNWFVVG